MAWKIFLLIFTFTLLEAFFAGMEIGIAALLRARTVAQKEEGEEEPERVQKLLGNRDLLFGSTMLGSIGAMVATSALITVLFYPHPHGVLYTLLVLGPFLLVFGEIMPKNLFQQQASRLIPRLALPLWILTRLLSPFVHLLKGVSRTILHGIDETTDTRTRESLAMVLGSPDQGDALQEMEAAIVHRIFRFSETTLHDCMVPLIQTCALEENATVRQALRLITSKGFSRIPIYRDRIDNIIGILYSFDLIGVQPSDMTITPLIRPPVYLPETTRAERALGILRKTRNHLAVVVDEYGGAVGIVTIEDILEEIVGEIYDEFDPSEVYLQPLGKGRYLVNARMEIEALNEKLGLGLPEGDYETLGGFLLERFGKIPKENESLTFRGHRFIIAKSSDRSIESVSLTLGEEKLSKRRRKP
ncbi:MAG: HlyC/CorC family transporter [Deltaproteobacteria bacterium]|nr:MAG: HlyC/CorC family transporter [Deltaproteobacteria bacterium]